MTAETKTLTVIGGGPGGYTAAFAAARAGMRVTLVECESLGGTCLNHGCIPTKTIKSSAEALELAQNAAAFGVRIEGGIHIDPAAVLQRKERVRSILCSGLEKTCASLGIDLVRGRGRILRAGLVELIGTGGTRTVEADNIIIATGSRPVELPGLPTDHTHILNSDDALRLESVPSSLIIVGGGVIGCEMACIYRAFGATVTLVEGQDRILPLPSVDEDISALLQREMKKRRIACETGCTLTNVTTGPDGVHAALAASPFAPAGAVPRPEKTVRAEKVLVTVGRAPCTDGLGLEEAGIAADARGWITADARMRTSVPHIYAIGDVLGPGRVMLAHAASAEALCAVADCLGKDTGRDMAYRHIPSAIFTSPEIGCVGMSERQARDAGHEVKTSVVQMRELGKAQAMSALPGFCKLVADARTDALLGVHMAGAHATDLVAEGVLALHLGAAVADVAAAVHAHPTLAEAMGEAALRMPQ
nr:dihydrolipoyl dehydrogenase [uncultured Desulfovibrio sp.]